MEQNYLRSQPRILLRKSISFAEKVIEQKTPEVNFKGFGALVEKMGVEPTTSCMPCKRSSQLSYIPIAGANIRQFFFTVQIL
jgi:hypothetical protein